ncbi:MAG: DUF6174 domain-containing protein [Anaerolineae bacterium]|nr:DUF6174 domain-containing protein [Anaerolineae bacterium]
MKGCVRVVLMVCMLVTVGCSGGRLVAQVKRAEQRWQRSDIGSYRIEVSLRSGTWHYESHVVTVRDGEVVDASASCVTAPMETALGKECEVEEFDPSTYTVPGLFVLARSLTEATPAGAVEIDFDDTYGFPKWINYDLADVIDEDQAWSVGAFEVLE